MHVFCHCRLGSEKGLCPVKFTKLSLESFRNLASSLMHVGMEWLRRFHLLRNFNYVKFVKLEALLYVCLLPPPPRSSADILTKPVMSKE